MSTSTGKTGSLAALFVNVVTVGFGIGLYIHNNTKCSWEKGIVSEVSLSKYFLGVYFTIHLLTWYVIFSFFFTFIVGTGVGFLTEYFLGKQYKYLILLLMQLAYGYWAAGEILGGWCDLEKPDECVQDPNAKCDSFLIKKVTRFLQSVCEAFTFDHDEDDTDVYYRNPNNICVYAFRYTGHFIMTLFSTTVSYLIFCFTTNTSSK